MNTNTMKEYDREFTATEYYAWIQLRRKLEGMDEMVFTEAGGYLQYDNLFIPDNGGYKVFYQPLVGWVAPDEKVYVRYSTMRRLAQALLDCRLFVGDDLDNHIEATLRAVGISFEHHVS